jgi:HAD superfamily hydrolase (TIGR01450 family)
MLNTFLSAGTRTSLRTTSRAAARRHASTFAVAFDIDGVLYRGSDDIAPAKAVIETLREKNIPVLFLTNGGGLTEALKVKHLGERLGVDGLEPKQMFQSHTPMKQLDEYKDKLVLAVGKDQAKHI